MRPLHPPPDDAREIKKEDPAPLLQRGTGSSFHGRCWTRTSDPYDVNVVLYQLS
jgi:hypothetical protein